MHTWAMRQGACNACGVSPRDVHRRARASQAACVAKCHRGQACTIAACRLKAAHHDGCTDSYTKNTQHPESVPGTSKLLHLRTLRHLHARTNTCMHASTRACTHQHVHARMKTRQHVDQIEFCVTENAWRDAAAVFAIAGWGGQGNVTCISATALTTSAMVAACSSCT